jgi:hypothetical protein
MSIVAWVEGKPGEGGVWWCSGDRVASVSNVIGRYLGCVRLWMMSMQGQSKAAHRPLCVPLRIVEISIVFEEGSL